MELRQLQYFVAAARAEHFTRAARRLNIVQSALSSSIRALETELDAQLFVRTTRRVRLTAAGRALLDKADAVLNAVDEARSAVQAVSHGEAGKLNIGTVHGLPAFLDLPDLLARFHDRNPNIEVRLIQAGATHLLEKLRSGLLDLAVLPAFDPPPDVTTSMIACEELVIVSAHTYRLPPGASLSLTQLAGHAFVDFEADLGTRKLVDRAFLESGAERHTAFEVSDLSTLLGLVERGLGVALVPESVARGRSSTLRLTRIAGIDACWELVLAISPAAAADIAPLQFRQLLAEDWQDVTEPGDVAA